jgi:hypothetical protein
MRKRQMRAIMAEATEKVAYIFDYIPADQRNPALYKAIREGVYTVMEILEKGQS